MRQLPAGSQQRFQEFANEAKGNRQSAESVGKYGMLLLAYEFYGEAVDCFVHSIALERGDEQWYYYLALAFHHVPEPDMAILALRTAIELKPDTIAFHEQMGDWLFEGDLEAALSSYQRALSLDANQASIHFALARCFERNEALAQAQRHYERAIDLVPEYADAHYALGMMLIRQGQSERGQRHLALHKSGGLTPRVPDPYIERIEVLSRSLKTLFNAATKLVTIGRMNDAANVLQRILEEDEHYALALNLLGFIRLQEHSYGEAAGEFQKALEADPTSYKTQSNLGETYMALGRVRDAEVLLKEALNVDPAHSASLRRLGILYTNSGRSAAAVPHYQKLVELFPSHTEWRMELALAYATSRQYQSMVEALREMPRSVSEEELSSSFANRLLYLTEAQRRYADLPPDFQPLAAEDFAEIVKTLEQSGLNSIAAQIRPRAAARAP